MDTKQTNEIEEDTLRSMLCEFYGKTRLSIIAVVWVNAMVFLFLAIFSAVKFFQTDQVKCQIMYTAIFICAVQMMGLIKVFAWQIFHKSGLKREIKRLANEIAEIKEAVKK